MCQSAHTQEFSEFDKQGALLRQASNPVNFQGDDDEGDEADFEDEDDDDDLDFSGGSSGVRSG
jgi:hypothetical protein